jgi:uncharacterized membrane protein YfcA
MFGQFLPSYFEWWHIPMVFLGGLIGESFGALVGGGSIVTIPALLLTGAPLQSAIAVDNAAALGTEAGILSETLQKVRDNKWLVLAMSVPITLGGILGTWLLLHVSADIIKYLVAATVIFVVIHSFVHRKPRHDSTVSKTNYALLGIILLLLGIYSNFISAGEGTFGKLSMMAILGMSFVQSQGLKATATMPSRMYSMIVTAIAGIMIWPYLLTMFVSNFIAGKYATKFAKRIPDQYMRTFLTIVSLLFVGYLLIFY